MADAIRFKLNEDDMAQASRLFAVNSLGRPKTLIGFAVIFVICLVLMSMIAGIVFPFSPERLARYWHYVLGATFLPFIVVIFLGLVVGPWRSRATYRQQKSLQVEIGLSWTEQKIEFDSEYGTFAMPWSHFTRFAEDRNTFVLFESDRLFRMIPKRVLDADTERSLRARLLTLGG
jgi:hypothetical protein